MSENQMQMPRYKCHKEVWALKIKEIVDNISGDTMIYPVEKSYAEFKVDKEYMQKHKPVVGGYYVVYDDGYKSFSPAKAFEEGYSIIKKDI